MQVDIMTKTKTDIPEHFLKASFFPNCTSSSMCIVRIQFLIILNGNYGTIILSEWREFCLFL